MIPFTLFGGRLLVELQEQTESGLYLAASMKQEKEKTAKTRVLVVQVPEDSRWKEKVSVGDRISVTGGMPIDVEGKTYFIVEDHNVYGVFAPEPKQALIVN